MSNKLFSLPILFVMLLSLALATTAVAAPPPQAEDKVYTIQKDDWLSKLAEKEYGDPLAFAAIFYYNNLKAADDDSLAPIEDPDLIEVGWTIYLPSSEEAASYMDDYDADDSSDDQDDDIDNSNEGDDEGNSNDDDGSNSNDDDDEGNSNEDNDVDNSNEDDDDSNSNEEDDNSDDEDEDDNSNEEDDD